MDTGVSRNLFPSLRSGRVWACDPSGRGREPFNYATVTDFYSGSGPYDAAFVQAFAASRTVRVPAGTYTVSNPIELFSGYALIGDSYVDTTIVSNAAALPVIRIKSGADKFEIRGLTISHAGTTPSAGGNGIRQEPGSTCDQGLIADCIVEFNWFGLNLEQTGRSVLQNVWSRKNTTDGFRMNAIGTNALQWQYEGCSAAQNGGDGFHWVTSGNASATSVGTVHNCTTFANAGRGLAFDGNAANPIAGVRISGGFFGEDRGDGIYLNTYSFGHNIEPDYMELSGGSGIYITTNNYRIHVKVGQVSGSGLDGLFSGAPDTNVVGGMYFANGRARVDGRQSGIYIYDRGTATITGVRCFDGGVDNQRFGVVANPDTLIVGCDLRGNGVSYQSLGGAITGNPAPQSTGNRT